MKSHLASVLIAAAQISCFGYTPIECNETSADRDWVESSTVVVGRVIAIERKDSIVLQKKKFMYVAKVKIGRVLKGKCAENEILTIYMGDYMQTVEDNTLDSVPVLANGHASLKLSINSLYCLFLKINTTPALATHRPSSCHYSIHEISAREADKQLVSFNDRWIHISEFIEKKKHAAQKAGMQEKGTEAEEESKER